FICRLIIKTKKAFLSKKNLILDKKIFIVMLVKIFGSAVFGIHATTITIEVNIDKGVGYHLVGLPDNAVKESSYRIAAALSNIGFNLPGKRITINMAPADMRKEGSAYDLPIAMG